MHDNIYNISKLLKELRIKKGLTQDELAEKLFLSRQAISRWETGKSIPDYDVLIKLSEIYEISIDELIYGEKLLSSKLTYKLISLEKEKRTLIKIKNSAFLIIIILIIIFSLLFTFFNYNKIKIYEFSGGNGEIFCDNGLIVLTTGVTYFKPSRCILNEEVLMDTESVKYYYFSDEKEVLIFETGTNKADILWKDNIDESTLINYKDIDKLSQSLYLRIKTDSKSYDIKLDVHSSYVNR